MKKESLEKGYKRFQLKKSGKLLNEDGSYSNAYAYVGELNSVVWKIPAYNERSRKNAKQYIKTLVDNMDEITKDFDTEPKISTHFNGTRNVVQKRTDREVVIGELFAYDDQFIFIKVSNGFNVGLYLDGTFDVIDHRQWFIEHCK